MGQTLPLLALDLVETGGVDEKDAAALVFVPSPHLAGLGLAVEGAGAEVMLTEEGVKRRGLADADPTKDGDMDVPALQLGQHGLHLAVVVRQGLPHLGGDARVRH